MGQYSNLLVIVLLVAVFWFVAIRPQQQRAKQQKAMLDALKPGDEIVTIGGLFATVVEAGERVRVKVADGSELEFAPQAISRVVPRGEEQNAELREDQDADREEPSSKSAAASSAESDEKAELDA
jgi:preprotein translocase subunit YajC